MTDETAVDPKSENKTDPKIVRLVAKILYKLDSKGGQETEGAEEDDAGFAAVRKDYQQKAKIFLRRLEKKGVTVSA